MNMLTQFFPNKGQPFGTFITDTFLCNIENLRKTSTFVQTFENVTSWHNSKVKTLHASRDGISNFEAELNFFLTETITKT